jgi:dipeptidyl aminopeptidase/acylaminoacyl peptidase
MTSIPRAFAGVALVTALAALAPLAAAGTLPPIEQFTRLPAIEGAELSPDGTHLAVLLPGPHGRERLGVMDLDPIGQPRVVAAFDDADVRWAHWVNDRRLDFLAAPRAAEVDRGGVGVFAVDRDGSDQRQLIAWLSPVADVSPVALSPKLLPYGWSVTAEVDDGSDDVLVQGRTFRNNGDLEDVRLGRLNTRTGTLHSLSDGMPEGTRDWVVDAAARPRLLTAEAHGRRRIYWRAPGTPTWQTVADFDPLGRGGFAPVFVDTEEQVLALARQHDDVIALYHFDAPHRRLDPDPLVKVPGFDLEPSFEIDSRSGRLLGIHFETDRPQSYWFDPAMRAIQKGIDAALPAGRSNRISCGRCASSRFLLVRSSSDRQPGQYFLFDRRQGSLREIGVTRPWIDEAAQGRRSFQRIPARDGLTIPLYVTRPAAAPAGQPLPAVVLVHGGPWVRGTDLGWHAEAQFLASRGYVVLEPEFRGSEGYGERLFKAGWKQWGQSMQDDLVDSVHWAARQGLVDPGRVCIEGSSYGGYAALMGVIATPGVFRCAVSYAGVTDISLMYDASWSDISDDAKRYAMPVLIGDPVKDAAMLDRNSPLRRAAEIKVPVLLAQGGVDRRVPMAHARRFAAAARDAGVDLEFVVYPDEGHGFFDPDDEADFFGRVERFLAKALASPAH